MKKFYIIYGLLSVALIGALVMYFDRQNSKLGKETERLFKPVDTEFKQSNKSKEEVNKAVKVAQLAKLKKDREKLNRTWRSYLDKSLELQKKELRLRVAISASKLELAKLELRQEQGEKLRTEIKEVRSHQLAIIAQHQLAQEDYIYNERQRAISLAKIKDFDVRVKKEINHKDCPDCSESVKVRARKCKHCGYMFELKN